MTPAARVAAAIAILDDVLAGQPAEARLIRWARSSRFAGSADRAAVRDLVYDTLRRRRTRAALGGGNTGRALMIGACREDGIDPRTLFDGGTHGPDPLTGPELLAGRSPHADEATDLPDWVSAILRADLGADFPGIAAALRDRAPVWLRANTPRVTIAQLQASLREGGIATRTDPRCPTALRVEGAPRGIQNSLAFREGLAELQDLSVQMACASLPIGVGDRVLDYCAGGGGKALALAARGAVVTAWDAAPDRMRDLPARALRAGADIARAPEDGPRGRYDLVLVDVPCSGSGTWRRTPDAKWRLTPDDLERLRTIQQTILDDAAPLVRPGGTLAYMTCSLFRSENEDQVAAFLSRHPGFALDAQKTLTPLVASDGFFVARLTSLMSA